MSSNTTRNKKIFAVLRVVSHGELVKPKDIQQTRSVNDCAYPSDVYLLSTLGSDFVSGITEKLKGSTWLSNEYLMPSILYNVIQDDGISSMTGRQITDKIAQKIKPVDEAAGVKYKYGYTITKNPSDMVIFWTRPNDGEYYRSFENPKYKGRRNMKKRRAEETDIQWFGNYGVCIVYTNSPNEELQKMSLHGLKNSIHKRSDIDISRYGISTPFIDPNDLERINIFGSVSSTYFESILHRIHSKKDSRSYSYTRDPERGIQIIRRGRKYNKVSLPELSQLSKDLGFDEVYVISSACRDLEEEPLLMVKDKWKCYGMGEVINSESTTGYTITPNSSQGMAASPASVASSQASAHEFKRPRNTSPLSPRYSNHNGGKKRSYPNKYTKVNKKSNTRKKCKKIYSLKKRIR